jgi:hypothetical protein
MLEQSGLLLGGWQPSWPEAGAPRTQPVLDLATARPLGFVRSKAGLRWPVLRWLSRPALEVYETEDASHLCTVARHPGLPWCWEVRDAENRRVAVVSRRRVQDGAGRPLARVEWPAGPDPGRFLTPQRAELGTFHLTPRGTALTFAHCLEQAPFAKMALLGAVLTYESSLTEPS